MKNLTDQLKAALIFDEQDAHQQALKMAYNSHRPLEHKAFEYGARSERTRTKAIDQALCECVSALTDGGYNSVREILALIAEGEGDDQETYMDMGKAALTKIDAALSALRAALEGRG